MKFLLVRLARLEVQSHICNLLCSDLGFDSPSLGGEEDVGFVGCLWRYVGVFVGVSGGLVGVCGGMWGFVCMYVNLYTCLQNDY